MPSTVRILFPVLPGLLLLPWSGPEGIRVPRDWREPAPAPCLAWAARHGDGDAVASLFVQARTLGERLRTGVPVAELEPLRRRLDLVTGALACLPGARSLPWMDWIEATQNPLPELALALFRGARRCLGPAVVPLIEAVDRRELPRALRLEMYATLWRLAPREALWRSRRLLLHERPRANDLLPAQLVERILVGAPGPEVDELLVSVARRPDLDDLARRQAIRALAARGSTGARGDLQAIVLQSSRSALLRIEALLALLTLLPEEEGNRFLLERTPSLYEAPRLYEVFRRLRAARGLPPLAPAPGIVERPLPER